MASSKIMFGIDLGTTNSSIARIRDGKPEVIRSETLKYTMPSCVHINRKQGVSVGDSAYRQMGEDMIKSFTTEGWEVNTFAEFKRTIGSDKRYECSNLGRSLFSEELPAEVLKQLKALSRESTLKAVVITVPAKFTPGQKAATVRAAELAGFEYCELLQEPVAASIAYGMEAEAKDGFWVVFDMGGGTFDAALLKVEDGIMNVVDTEGDNYLGGKNLDYAIVDEVVIPYMDRNYSMESILDDEQRKEQLRNAWKSKAEEAKIKLSLDESTDILSDLGEDYGVDDEGNELAVDISLSRKEYNELARPYFQKAIDITQNLLKRNNLKSDDLATIVMVGGPAYTPLLQEMARQQLTPKADFSNDPMTIVARGAALHAATIDIPYGVAEVNRAKVNLELKYETTTVETREWLTLKVLAKESDSVPSDGMFMVIKRNDGAWTTDRMKIGTEVELVELSLVENTPNQFSLELYDPKGTRLDCEPCQITIIQGFKHGQKGATLPYQISIEIHDDLFERDGLVPIKGLEKNKVTPAVGTENSYKTPVDLRPGNASDYVEIPIYAGAFFSEGTKAIYSDLVTVVKISGDDVPALVRANSEVDLTIKITRDEKMSLSAYFPCIDYSYEIDVEFSLDRVHTAEEIESCIAEARSALENIYDETDTEKADRILKDLDDLLEKFQKARLNDDNRLQTLNSLRALQREIDNLEKQVEIPRLEERLRNAYAELENLIQKIRENSDEETLNMGKIDASMADHKNKLDRLIKDRDRSHQKLKLMGDLAEEISAMDMGIRFALAGRQICVNILKEYAAAFDQLDWSDRAKARSLIQTGLSLPPDAEQREFMTIVIQVNALLPYYQQHKLV